MLSIKQGDIKYHFLVFGMIRPGIEPRSPGPLANAQLIRLMARCVRRTNNTINFFFGHLSYHIWKVSYIPKVSCIYSPNLSVLWSWREIYTEMFLFIITFFNVSLFLLQVFLWEYDHIFVINSM